MLTTRVGCTTTLTSRDIQFDIHSRMSMNRFATRQREEDEYIQTYKVGKKKQALDNLVMMGMKKFSIIGV